MNKNLETSVKAFLNTFVDDGKSFSIKELFEMSKDDIGDSTEFTDDIKKDIQALMIEAAFNSNKNIIKGKVKFTDGIKYKIYRFTTNKTDKSIIIPFNVNEFAKKEEKSFDKLIKSDAHSRLRIPKAAIECLNVFAGENIVVSRDEDEIGTAFYFIFKNENSSNRKVEKDGSLKISVENPNTLYSVWYNENSNQLIITTI